MAANKNPWGLSLHIPLLVGFQIVFLVLFGLFTRYDPSQAYRHNRAGEGVKAESERGSVEQSQTHINNVYPMFQDVHVMIFIGFGFLMTFLKKYGLSAVSLNLLISALSIQWTILVHGFFHLHYDACEADTAVGRARREVGDRVAEQEIHYNKFCHPDWPWININLGTLLSADFAVAAVLISFGVVLGTTSPVQLVIMAGIEIVLFNINEVIGRSYIGAVDAGDTIFVHLFGAYFGLAMSRVLYDRSATTSSKAGANRISDLFSMVGTIFLWMFWPSFNSAAAASGDAQMRAVINTYLSLCAACCCAFAVSAFVSAQRKFTMEHIQNATLAGGVAVGAAADMILTPLGALVIGSLAGAWSTIGYEHVSPWLVEKLKITDTCGVHNLHGMPAVMGGLLSVLLAGIASNTEYDQYNDLDSPGATSSLTEIFPPAGWTGGWSPGRQAGAQLLAMIVTLVFALGGGLATGFLLKCLEMNEKRTINERKEQFFDDDLYFYDPEQEQEQEQDEEAGVKSEKSGEQNNVFVELVEHVFDEIGQTWHSQQQDEKTH